MSKPLWLELAEAYDRAEQEYFLCDPDNQEQMERLDQILGAIIAVARYTLSDADHTRFEQGS